jgi:hypothetical protein
MVIVRLRDVLLVRVRAKEQSTLIDCRSLHCDGLARTSQPLVEAFDGEIWSYLRRYRAIRGLWEHKIFDHAVEYAKEVDLTPANLLSRSAPSLFRSS